MSPEDTFRLYPTFINAKLFLQYKQIHIPFASIINQTRQQSISVIINSQSLQQSQGKSKRIRMHGGIDSEKIHNLSRIDFLHDIYNGFSINHTLICKVLENTTLTDIQKNNITRINLNNKGVTKQFASIIYPTMPGTLIKWNSKESVSKDMELYKWVIQWITQKHINIVLDGVYGVYGSFDTNVDEEAASRSLALFAFIMVLLGNSFETVIVCSNRKSKNNISAKVKVLPLHANSITFLTGDFQTIDIQGYNTFLTDWIANLDELLHWADIVTIKEQIVPPINQRFKITPDGHAILDGLYNISNKQWKPRNKNTNSSILQYIDRNLTFNYTKTQLQFIMKYFETLLETEWNNWTPLLHKLIDINFFRDSNINYSFRKIYSSLNLNI
jgi:hypothetical protein